MDRRKFLELLGLSAGAAAVANALPTPPVEKATDAKPETFAWVKAKDLTAQYPYKVRACDLKQGDLIKGACADIEHPLRVVFVRVSVFSYPFIYLLVKPMGVKDQQMFSINALGQGPYSEDQFMLTALYPAAAEVEVVGHEVPEHIWRTPVVMKPRNGQGWSIQEAGSPTYGEVTDFRWREYSELGSDAGGE